LISERELHVRLVIEIGGESTEEITKKTITNNIRTAVSIKRNHLV